MKSTRPRRTTIAGARAQFADIVADVVNVSGTGALVRTAHPQAIGSQWPLLLEIGDAPLEFTARVVRCEPVAGPLSTSTGQFNLALAFVNPSDAAVARLEQAGKTSRRAEVGVRRLHVSLVRRCPKCQSRDVAKEASHSYSCCQCGQVFTGFRIGVFRFAR